MLSPFIPISHVPQKISRATFKRPQTQPNIYMCLLNHADERPLANIKTECQTRPAKLLISGRSGTQYVAKVTKLVYSHCGVHAVESYGKESSISDTNWLRCLLSS